MCIYKPHILIRECVDVPEYTWILSFNDRAVSMMGEVIRVSGRAPDVGDLLREAMVSQRFADVALCCSGGQRFLAHRLVLSAASPYLQDVLLAHGKAAGSSEPITIILAEVEGPELSAILGFVYTGSATIPKSRLEAFTRAAETLHVRIPTFGSPVRLDVGNYEILSSSCNHELDCKFDCVKVEETTRLKDARYLRCEQYPSWEGWLNPSDWHYHRECTRRVYQPEDWILRRKENGVLQRQREAETSSFSEDVEATRRKHLSQESFGNSCCIDDGYEKSVHDLETSRSDGYSGGRKSPWIEGDSSVSNSNSAFLDPSKLTPEIRKEPESYEFPVQPNPGLEAFVAPPSKLSDSFSASENYSSRTNLESCRAYEERIEENLRENRDFEPRSNLKFDKYHYEHSSSFSSKDPISPSSNLQPGTKILSETTVSSNIPSQFTTNLTNLTIPSKNSNFCSDNCCTWRTPKRHVANRVPASPWCQLARPAHHSPKTRPILPRNPNENVEPSVHGDWNGTVLPIETRTRGFSPSRITYVDSNQVAVGSLRENLEGNASSDGTGAIYGFQVPETTGGFCSSVEESMDYSKRPRSPKFFNEKFYEKSIFPAPGNFPTEQFPARTIPHKVIRSTEKPSALVDILQVQSRPQQSNETSNIILNHEPSRVRISQHATPHQGHPNVQIINDPPSCNLQTSPRIELSHPISRLCDSVRNIDDPIPHEPFFIDKDASESSSLGIQPIQPKLEDSLDFRSKTNSPVPHAILQSDDNNNEPGIDDPVLDVPTNPDLRLNGDVNENATPDDGLSNGEDHKCEQCGKTFVTRASLKVHGRTHSGEKPFRCTDCGKEFSQLRNYKYHRSVHEGTREFAATCPECGKYFNDRGYLSSHMKIHRNRKEYGCSECGKSFNQRVAYNMHVRIHTGVKPHQCDQCGKAFSRKMLLKQHLRTHSGERPYQCQICHKAFADRSNMTLHTRLHSGLKPYQCTLCSKAFTKKHHLKTHLNYHTGTKPYSCPNCSLRFSQSSNMRTHYKKCCSMAGIEGFDRHEPPAGSEQKNQGAGDQATNSLLVASGVEAPSVGGRTNALTPPNSDQESSLQTPTKINHAISLRSNSRPRKIDINVIPDT